MNLAEVAFAVVVVFALFGAIFFLLNRGKGRSSTRLNRNGLVASKEPPPADLEIAKARAGRDIKLDVAGRAKVGELDAGRDATVQRRPDSDS